MAWEHWKPGPNGKLIQVTDEAFQQHDDVEVLPPDDFEIRDLQTIVTHGRPIPSPNAPEHFHQVPIKQDGMTGYNYRMQRKPGH